MDRFMLHKDVNFKQSQKGETWQGYIRLFGKCDCPYAKTRGRVFEHVYVWWKNYGDSKPILKGELIHHINGNKKDNRIENLDKMTLAEHNKLHFCKRTPQYIKDYRKEWNRQNKLKNGKAIAEKRRLLWKINHNNIKNKQHNYAKKNPNKIRLWSKNYREKNREKINKRKKEDYLKNKVRIKEQSYNGSTPR